MVLVMFKVQENEGLMGRCSAGLTLTSCSVVHLLEPVLKHSFELQGEHNHSPVPLMCRADARSNRPC